MIAAVVAIVMLGVLARQSDAFAVNRPSRYRFVPLYAKLSVERGKSTYNVWYDWIERTSSTKLPLVVLHGGPGIPSDYLQPLQDVIDDRSILFHDQLGCGFSDAPRKQRDYSIDSSVDDVVQILAHVGIKTFHLYGQSYGGILAFEYLKKQSPSSNCQTVVLSSAPSCVKQVENEMFRLEATVANDEAFRINFQCRTPDMPKPLLDAYSKVGPVWRGTGAIANYKATAPDMPLLQPALVLRGQYDFCSFECIKPWKSFFETTEWVEMRDCSHHISLEKPKEYAEVLSSFWNRYEERQ